MNPASDSLAGTQRNTIARATAGHDLAHVERKVASAQMHGVEVCHHSETGTWWHS